MIKLEYIGKCLLVKMKGRKILAIGDLHLGYEEYMNRTGVFVSRKMFEESISYLDKIFNKIGKVDEIVLLGDVKHDFGTITKQEWNDVLTMLDYLQEKCKKIILIRGNHDAIMEPIVKKRAKVTMVDCYVVSGLSFFHGHKEFEEAKDKKVKIWIMSHGHPAVKISDGTKIEKYKCFLVGKFRGKTVIIVPSFFAYSEGSDPRENDLSLAWNFDFNKFETRVVQDSSLEVLDFGKLRTIR